MLSAVVSIRVLQRLCLQWRIGKVVVIITVDRVKTCTNETMLRLLFRGVCLGWSAQSFGLMAIIPSEANKTRRRRTQEIRRFSFTTTPPLK